MVVDEVQRAGVAGRVTIQSFDWRTLTEIRAIAPGIETACLTIESPDMDTVKADTSGASPWQAGLKHDDYGNSLPRLAKAAGCGTWSMFWRNLTPQLIAEAHALELKVLPWTVNEKGDMARLIDWKVDGIITDYPDRLREVMADKGLPLPDAVTFVEHLRTSIELLPSLAKFAFGMTLIIVIPRLSRRVRLPEAVGLLLSGVIFGPHVLDVFPREHPVGEFFAELGMLLLMFFAGLEINLELFRQQITRSVLFGVATTTLPMLLATLVMLWLGYGLLTAIVVGSLVASHTMLGSTIVARLGLRGREPIVVTYGATMVSDTLSLLVFAVCVPLYASGFSASGLALQVVEIVVFVPAVLFGLGRLGARLLRKLEDEEETYFIVMLVILAVTALLAQLIDLPGIVGTFLAGLAVNAAVKDKPAKGKLEFLGNSLFIPTFFAVTGFLIDPFALGRGLANDFLPRHGTRRRARRRQVDRGRSHRPRIRLRAGGAQDNVVAHAAATRGDAGGNARCVQDRQCGRPAAGRRPDRQQRSGDRGGHGDPGTGADPAFRTPHVRHPCQKN